MMMKSFFSTHSITIIVYHTLATAFSSSTKSENATNYYSCHQYSHQNSQQYRHNYDIYQESAFILFTYMYTAIIRLRDSIRCAIYK